MTRYYQVAGHRFRVCAETDVFGLMGSYDLFACDEGEVAFSMTVENGEVSEYIEELRQEDEGQVIVCGHTPDGQAVFEFIWGGTSAGWLVCSADYREGTLLTPSPQACGEPSSVKGSNHRKAAIDNALMVMYALATAEKGTALFHAAVVSHEGRAYMFLGPSGTGKSTHARLWLRYIEGTELVNDDNPVVRDGMVYGSPWSGKTPCYRHVNYPLGGIVLLSQAPHNRIRRLNGIEAYAALVTSISGKRWDGRIADGLHQTENTLAMTVPLWHLECLPDEAAARVCQTTVDRR